MRVLGLLAAFVLLLVVAAGMLYVQLRVTAREDCGPVPVGAFWNESANPVRAESFWPIGRSCDWYRRGGEPGAIRTYVGSYGTSALTYVLGAAGVAAGVAAFVVSRPERGPEARSPRRALPRR